MKGCLEAVLVDFHGEGGGEGLNVGVLPARYEWIEAASGEIWKWIEAASGEI